MLIKIFTIKILYDKEEWPSNFGEKNANHKIRHLYAWKACIKCGNKSI